MNNNSRRLDPGNLLSRIAALEQLIEVYENSVLEQTDQLYKEIGERTRIEKELRENIAFSKMLMDAIPLPVFYKNKKGIYLGFNKAYADFYGKTQQELIGKSVFDIAPNDLAEVYHAKDLELFQHPGSQVYESQVKDAQGVIHEVIFHKAAFTDIDGNVCGLIGAILDISERKKFEQKLRESQQYLADIIQFYPDATMVIDNQGKVTAWNRAMEEFSGTKAAEMLGKGGYEYSLCFYSERRPILIDLVALPEAEANARYPFIERRGDTLIGEAYIHNARGEEVYYQGYAAALRNSRGEVIGAIESIRDLTSRKKTEEALVEKENKLRTLTQTAQDAIIMIDHGGDITFWNPAAEKMFGYSPDEALGQELHTLLAPPRYHESCRKGLAHFRESGQGMAIGKTIELEALRKGGEEFPIEISLSALLMKNNWHAVGILREITERKQAEEKIRRLNEELEVKVRERTKQLLDAQDDLVRKEKLALLGQVAGSVGHELRNPLGVMNNAVYFLQTILADADETTREYLNIIKDEIAVANRIVSDLLDSVRSKPPNLASVGVGELIGQTLCSYPVPFSVAVKVEIPTTLPALRVDPLQMQQVFRNLISNAVEAMPEGGELVIRAVENRSDSSVTISVRDRGGGIASAVLDKLFQPLVTTKARGIGLGLVVVKNLTQANGGTVTVQSEAGHGTTFSVTLPVCDIK